MNREMRIGTRDNWITGSEVLGCVLLKLLPRYMNATIIRYQNKDIFKNYDLCKGYYNLKDCDILVGVGGDYNPNIHRYDYRMREFRETASTVLKNPNYNCKIKLSSAGLIYCHFGHEILRKLLPHIREDEIIDEFFKEIYDTIIVEIDAISNNQRTSAYHLPYYEPAISMCDDLCEQIMNGCRNTWKWKANIEEDELFEEAMVMVSHVFMDFINCAEKVWLPARRVVQNAIDNRFKVHPSGTIIELSESVPWQQHLYRLEREMKLYPKISFVIFSSRNGYLIHCVPITGKVASHRTRFPNEWRGLRNDALVAVCEIGDAQFVHSSGLIAGHRTRNGAITMAMSVPDEMFSILGEPTVL